MVECHDWSNKPTAEKTWDEAQAYFPKADKNQSKLTTTVRQGDDIIRRDIDVSQVLLSAASNEPFAINVRKQVISSHICLNTKATTKSNEQIARTRKQKWYDKNGFWEGCDSKLLGTTVIWWESLSK